MAAKKKSDKAVRDAADKLRDMSAEELRGKLTEQRQLHPPNRRDQKPPPDTVSSV